MLRSATFAVVAIATSLVISSAFADSSKKNAWGQWHQTHGIEKFPCMNEKENEYFQRWIHVAHNDENKKIMAEHRKQVRPGSRVPASIKGEKIVSQRFVCPPFRGVRNPHPEIVEFGKAAQFEHIKITNSGMQILQGRERGKTWPLQYKSDKGYFEGSTPAGTPTNVIPLVPPTGEKVRFLVQYLIWKDKTPPVLTLCYREDLHNQCNPYPQPVARPIAPADPKRLPASEPSKPSKP